MRKIHPDDTFTITQSYVIILVIVIIALLADNF